MEKLNLLLVGRLKIRFTIPPGQIEEMARVGGFIGPHFSSLVYQAHSPELQSIQSTKKRNNESKSKVKSIKYYPEY